VAAVCAGAAVLLPRTQRMFWGHWQPVAERMLTACEHSTSGTITTWTWGHSTITLPCSRLHR
jgi:hypothetical protein